LTSRLADLKIYGPAGAGDPAPAPADPVKYTCELSAVLLDFRSDLLVVPWEEVNAAATAAENKPDSPPPTFATATATAQLLTDRREIVNDSSQGRFPSCTIDRSGAADPADIWNEDMDLAHGSRPGTPGMDSALRTPVSASATNIGQPVGQLRSRVPHGVPGETIEMISAPVARR
jgi:hypothetical protein